MTLQFEQSVLFGILNNDYVTADIVVCDTNPVGMYTTKQ